MKVLWKGGTPRGGMGQWLLFGAVALVVGLAACILAALGLVVGALLAGIISVGVAVASRRRAAAAPYAVRTAEGRAAEGKCVELDKDAYTVRIVDDKKG